MYNKQETNGSGLIPKDKSDVFLEVLRRRKRKNGKNEKRTIR